MQTGNGSRACTARRARHGGARGRVLESGMLEALEPRMLLSAGMVTTPRLGGRTGGARDIPGTSVTMGGTALTTASSGTSPVAKVEAAASVGPPVYQAMAWDTVPADATNLAHMVAVWPGSDPLQVAAQSRAQAPGMAALLLCGWTDQMIGNPLDQCVAPDGTYTGYASPWLDHAAADLAPRLKSFLGQVAAAGGRADYVVLDFERSFSNWVLTPEWLAAIVNDPRGLSLLASAGLANADNVLNWSGSADHLAWNAATSALINAALNQAVYQVVQGIFPAAKMSNFGNMKLAPSEVVPDANGDMQFSTSFMGNRQAPVLYGYIGYLANIALDGTNPYGASPYAVLRWEINTLRAVRRSDPTAMEPWIANPAYSESPLAGTPYYREMLLHAALSGAEAFLLWNPAPPWGSNTDAQSYQVNSILSELNQQVGTATRTVVTSAGMAWNSSVVASGLQLGTKKILWRVTAPAGATAIRVVETGQILALKAGDPGVWYTSPAGKTRTFVTV